MTKQEQAEEIEVLKSLLKRSNEKSDRLQSIVEIIPSHFNQSTSETVRMLLRDARNWRIMVANVESLKR